MKGVLEYFLKSTENSGVCWNKKGLCGLCVCTLRSSYLLRVVAIDVSQILVRNYQNVYFRCTYRRSKENFCHVKW